MTEKTNETRTRQPDARLNPLESVDLLVGSVGNILQRDADKLGAAIIAYSLAAATKQPYADAILDQVIQMYATEAGLELPSEMNYESLAHERLLEPIGRAAHPRYRQELGEVLAGAAGPGRYAGQQTGEQYGRRQ